MRTATVLLAVLAGAACAPDSGSKGTELQPGDYPVVPTEPSDVLWFVDSAPSLILGGETDDGEAKYFSDVRFAGSLDDGGVVVVDGASREIRWFDADGTLAAVRGGRGEGPGEFRYIDAATILKGDTLLVVDKANQRLTFYSPVGAMRRSQSIDIGAAVEIDLHQIGGLTPILAVRRAKPNFGGREYNLGLDSTFLLGVRQTGVTDTIARLAGPEAVTWVDYADGRPSATAQLDLPFAPPVLTAAVGDFVALSASPGGNIHFLSENGHTALVAKVNRSPARLIDRTVRAIYAEAEVARATAAGAPKPLAEAGVAARLELLATDRTVPVYDEAVSDLSRSTAWFRHFSIGDGDSRWSVFSETGHHLATVVTPGGFALTHVGRSALTGTFRDPDGVESVQVLELGAEVVRHLRDPGP